MDFNNSLIEKNNVSAEQLLEDIERVLSEYKIINKGIHTIYEKKKNDSEKYVQSMSEEYKRIRKTQMDTYNAEKNSQIRNLDIEKTKVFQNEEKMLQVELKKREELRKKYEDVNMNLRTEAWAKTRKLKVDCFRRINQIKSDLEIGKNARLFLELKEKSISDFVFVEKKDIEKIDFLKVQYFVDLFNSESGVFKKKDAWNHGTQLWSFINWAFAKIEQEVQEIEANCEQQCQKNDTELSNIEKQYTDIEKQVIARKNQVEKQYKERVVQIENEYNAKIRELEQQYQQKQSMLEQEAQKTREKNEASYYEKINEHFNEFYTNFQQMFPKETVQEYLQYHYWVNRLVPENYICRKDFSEGYEIGYLSADATKYYYAEQIKKFLITEYEYLFNEERILVPYFLDFMEKQNLTISYDAVDDDIARQYVQYMATSILLTSPPGRINFAFCDPLKATNTFAPFNKFVDYNKASSKILTGGIATSPASISEKLSIISEHIKNVISSCLQSNEMTIQEYNKLAGTNAEPYLYLIIMDFPAGFNTESMKTLQQIMEAGPRCGVYTILMVSEQQLAICDENIRKLYNSIRIKASNYKNNGNRCQKEMDNEHEIYFYPMLTDYEIDAIAPIFKKGVEDAGRIIIRFDDIRPKGALIDGDSSDNLEIPIGLVGVNNVQNFILGGEGVTHHALIAGSTGSGKTTLLHTIITNALLKYSNEDLELYMVDFKHGVEFKVYGNYNLPAVKLVAIESDRKLGYDVLDFLDREQKRRSEVFKEISGCSNIKQYREKTGIKMPRIMLIIDEFQELFNSQNSDFISSQSADMLQRVLAQGRAFGIHVILATQSIANVGGLNSAIYNLIAVRIALKSTPEEAKYLLKENAEEIKLLTDSGMAIYNHNYGLDKASTVFRVGKLETEQQDEILKELSDEYTKRGIVAQTKVVDSTSQYSQKEGINTNYFERCEEVYPQRSGTERKKIILPYAVDDDNHLVYCNFENENFGAYIMGAAGSGKSVLLDDIIVGLISNFHPDEVELWLMDFMKTGFAKYAKKCPPHIKYAILENSEDVVYGMIDKACEEMERRKKEFSIRGWEKLTDVPIDVYMPAIFLIIDEFAEMSQIIAETMGEGYKDNYAIKLENLLREGRKLGFKFIFASQSFESGVRGLTEDAKKQIQMRLALKNTKEEIYGTLQLGINDRTERIESWVSSLPPYKTLVKTLEKDSHDKDIVRVEKVNNLKIDKNEINQYLDSLNEKYYTIEQADGQQFSYINKQPLIFANDTLKTYDSQVELFDLYDKKLEDNDEYDDDDIVLYPGSSKGFEGINPVLIHKDACENILFAGADAAAISSTLLTIRRECIRQNVKVSVWTDSRNIIYRKYLKHYFDEAIIFKGIDDVCLEVERLKKAKKEKDTRDEFIIVLGCRNLFDEFDLYEADDLEQDSVTYQSVKSSEEIEAEFADLDSEWEKELFNPGSSEGTEQVNEVVTLEENDTSIIEAGKTYDAREDILSLLKRAAKDGKHFLVCFDNVADFTSTKLDSRFFKHKLLLSMNSDFSYHVDERSVQTMASTEIMYVGQKFKNRYDILLHKEIAFAGYSIDENGEVFNVIAD